MKKTHRQAEFVKNFCKALHFPLHISSAFLPEIHLFSFFEANRGSLLQGAHTTEANARVRCCYIFDQMLGTDQVPNAPTRGVKVLANRANGERQVGNLRR